MNTPQCNVIRTLAVSSVLLWAGRCGLVAKL